MEKERTTVTRAQLREAYRRHFRQEIMTPELERLHGAANPRDRERVKDSVRIWVRGLQKGGLL